MRRTERRSTQDGVAPSKRDLDQIKNREAAEKAQATKTAKLRALRLAKEAEDAERAREAEAAKASKGAGAKKRARTAAVEG
jgi:hypothetical protein